MKPDFLAVGHIVKDISAGVWRPGGSVSYATLQASRLGLGVAAVTACGPDIEPHKALPWAEWTVVPSANTTTFENVYRERGRNQRVLATAAPISVQDIPAEWRSALIVLLGPVAGEIAIDPGLLRPPNGTLGLCAQGWLREIDDDGVKPKAFEPAPDWLQGDVVFVSEEDLEEPERAEEWIERVGIVVLTRGDRGCKVWADGHSFETEAFSARSVDPTGAGDAFAAAFLVALSEGKDAREAARFASAAGSLVVRDLGLAGISDRSAIEAVMASAEAVRR